ncbi:glycoside hydrolase family 5 protein [Fistulina hepatica ATCC 64428]|uniref:Glycoside hydrolase family 5 protein n=1 Tax=Fistulina hepatica ATCC 64428 TaxID=1128425 RepID=A0A0D7A0M2_9AGAR|nr:glycoside hydrolase family 5 protein [Fistulina hepatica ATCC 64428]
MVSQLQVDLSYETKVFGGVAAVDIDANVVQLAFKATCHREMRKIDTIDDKKKKIKKMELRSQSSHPFLDPSYHPGATPSYAHDWSPQSTGGLRIHGRHFIDKYGRVCQLRGVNVSGSCKTPINHDDDTFPHDHRFATFVGRPFPIDEAPEHLARLRRWGLTFVRFLVTWEAIEHDGPGMYDAEYLAYLRELLSLFPKYGILTMVNMHQDVWSRFTGGSGAPAWTVEAVGFDLHALEETHAAFLKGVKGGGHHESERGIWPCGYQKLSAATMATCFWAGDTFAPKLLIDGVPVQTYLQNAFLNMFETLVKAVGDLDAVMGFEMMNEPHRGYIELKSLHAFDYNTDLHLDYIPTAFESFQLGAGYPTEVAKWTRSFPFPTTKTGSSVLNVEGRSAWRADGPTKGQCLWEMHGVWGWDVKKDMAVVLRESYFVKHPMTGRKIDWYTDFYYPFVQKWAERIQPSGKLVFVESIPNEEYRPRNMVYAPHWYDLNALFSKAFGDFSVNVQGLSRGMFLPKALYWGQKGARDNYALQIRNVVQAGYRSLGELPVLIGECGVPMDMNEGKAFETDDWRWQSRMMDAMIVGLERALVGFTLWNYNPLNSDETGDTWNGENFSWFSRRRALPPFLLSYEQASPTLDNGGRILSSVVRPYPAKTAGIPLKWEYEVTTGRAVFEWITPKGVGLGGGNDDVSEGANVDNPPVDTHVRITSYETEIFVPSGGEVVVTELAKGDRWTYDENRQTLFVVTANNRPGTEHRLVIQLDPPRMEPGIGSWIVNDFWGDFGSLILGVLCLTVALVAFVAMMVAGR